jgi:hypothetical protein
VAASAVAVAALPVVLWFHVGTVPVNPEYGRLVAVIDPVPVGARLAPDPTSMAAIVLVELVSAENAVAPVEDAVIV